MKEDAVVAKGISARAAFHLGRVCGRCFGVAKALPPGSPPCIEKSARVQDLPGIVEFLGLTQSADGQIASFSTTEKIALGSRWTVILSQPGPDGKKVDSRKEGVVSRIQLQEKRVRYLVEMRLGECRAEVERPVT
ncbi:MAG: hypothetical protein HQL31_11155 [Planctomycetes bacterium]|nr:hypothetical protein [Planctomycetota bacterium]